MAEPKFVPKPGQTDYTNIRYCPVINCVVTYQDKVLLVHRSSELNLYPGYWNGVSGFLDDQQSIEDKVKEELLEELYIDETQIASIERGSVLVQESEMYPKTWIVFPVHVEVKTDKFKLDYEAQDAKWYEREQIKQLKVVPGFEEVLAQFSKN